MTLCYYYNYVLEKIKYIRDIQKKARLKEEVWTWRKGSAERESDRQSELRVKAYTSKGNVTQHLGDRRAHHDLPFAGS